MDTGLIRALDRFVGKPACGALSVYERLRPTPPVEPAARPRKLLFVKLVEMGSTVLASPAFAEGERLVGRDNLYLLVFERNRAIADVLPHIPPENVITVDDSGPVRFGLSLASALRELRRVGIDAAVDMEGLPRASALITYLTGATWRAGYFNYKSEGPYRGRLFTHELGYTFQHHVSEMFLSLVLALREPPHDRPMLKRRPPAEALRLPRFEPNPGACEQVTALLCDSAGWPRPADGGLPVGRRVILNPNCRDQLPLRKWPEEQFVALGRRLLQAHEDMAVVITGNPQEAEASARLARTIGPTDRAISVAGRTDMHQLLTLYTLCDAIVSADSGPCHFAALTPISIVALFGPETPILYAPLGERVTTLTAGLACSPCLNILNHRNSPCGDNRCMAAIDVDQVFDATIAALDARESD